MALAFLCFSGQAGAEPLNVGALQPIDTATIYTPIDSILPAAAFDGENWLVVTVRRDGAAPLIGVRIAEDGSTIGQPFTLGSEPPHPQEYYERGLYSAMYVGVIFDGQDFVVAWTNETHDAFGVQRVTPDGQPGAVIERSGHSDDVRLAVNENGDVRLVRDASAGSYISYSLVGDQLREDGSISLPGTRLLDTVFVGTETVNLLGTGDGASIVRLAEDASVNGSTVLPIEPRPAGALSARLFRSGDGYLVTVGESGQARVIALDSSTAVVANKVLAAAPNQEGHRYAPQLVETDSGFLMVTRVASSWAYASMFVNQLTPDLDLVDPKGVYFSNNGEGDSDEGPGTIVMGATKALILYRNMELKRLLVDPETFTFVPSSGLIPRAEFQTRPTTALGEQGYLIAWEEAGAIRGALLDHEGALTHDLGVLGPADSVLPSTVGGPEGWLLTFTTNDQHTVVKFVGSDAVVSEPIDLGPSGYGPAELELVRYSQGWAVLLRVRLPDRTSLLCSRFDFVGALQGTTELYGDLGRLGGAVPEPGGIAVAVSDGSGDSHLLHVSESGSLLGSDPVEALSPDDVVRGVVRTPSTVWLEFFRLRPAGAWLGPITNPELFGLEQDGDTTPLLRATGERVVRAALEEDRGNISPTVWPNHLYLKLVGRTGSSFSAPPLAYVTGKALSEERAGKMLLGAVMPTSHYGAGTVRVHWGFVEVGTEPGGGGEGGEGGATSGGAGIGGDSTGGTEIGGRPIGGGTGLCGRAEGATSNVAGQHTGAAGEDSSAGQSGHSAHEPKDESCGCRLVGADSPVAGRSAALLGAVLFGLRRRRGRRTVAPRAGALRRRGHSVHRSRRPTSGAEPRITPR